MCGSLVEKALDDVPGAYSENRRREYCLSALVFQARQATSAHRDGTKLPCLIKRHFLPGCPDLCDTLFQRLAKLDNRSDELDSINELVSIAVLITYDRIQIRSQDGNMIFLSILRNKVSHKCA